MKEGFAPLNPIQFCRYPQGQASLQKKSLRVVWLPEGNGASLFEDNNLLALIPPWSRVKGFHGYARDCIGTGPLSRLGVDGR